MMLVGWASACGGGGGGSGSTDDGATTGPASTTTGTGTSEASLSTGTEPTTASTGSDTVGPTTGAPPTTTTTTGVGETTDPGETTANTTGEAEPPDLCAGLVQDLMDRPMTPLAKPGLGEAVVDAEFGTTIRRITSVEPVGENPVIKPAYSTIAAWNTDETRLILYDVSKGHLLYDGETYEPLKSLPIAPPDLEQFYWHGSEPSIVLYVHGKTLVRFDVDTEVEEPVHTFDFCGGPVSAGSDPLFSSWDSDRLGLGCDDQVFVFDVATNSVLGQQTLGENPAQVAPSGALAYLSDTGRVTDPALNVLRTLDLAEPWGHASLGRLTNGHDTWNGVVYDAGPGGNDDIGMLVTWDLTDGTSKVIVGPKTGYPYPPAGHISALAIHRPGWVVVSTIGDPAGQGLLDLELLLADTNTGQVCRAGRHRSWGHHNMQIGEPYWAAPTAVPSPSGTRILFGSDWGGGGTVDTYVVELPSYTP
ncbi:hypothetical protein SAMN02745121_08698 [Nannocystis exedens]|uniref:Uncharacterized protein n=2 Tax=Nannocystis exedens TaxID=54 RepID=A0A1I2IHZ2_9BACT|nr:hypothetical protein NAEX_00194 [Nannocystis exedens]SFF41258.1 hypothetical protein SAMN02745121_08698 [Nannocystis exedens]